MLFVKSLSGKAITLEGVALDETIELVKERLRAKEDIATESMRIIFAGRECLGGDTVQQCGLKNECTIHLVIRADANG